MTTPTWLDDWVAVEHTADVIPLDPEILDLSPVPAQERWTYGLQQLAVQGFERWLREREPSLSFTALNSAAVSTALGQVGPFKVCLIPVGLADDEVAIPQVVIEQPDSMAHFYVTVAIDEEAEVASLGGFLTYDQLTAACADIAADVDQTYPLSAVVLNPDGNALLLFLQCLSPDEIALPVPTTPEPFSLVEAIRQPLANAGTWLQQQADSLLPNDVWQPIPAMALRFDTESIRDQLTAALQDHSLPTTLPAEAREAYQIIALAGCTFRLFAAVWPEPDGSGDWMLLTILCPEPGQPFPPGVSLIIDEITPERPRVELARETLAAENQTTALFAQVKGNRHDVFDITVAVADTTVADNAHRRSAAIQFQLEEYAVITTHVFQLSVRRINDRCTFELSGDGVRKVCELDYPASLDKLYLAWQKAYIGYYGRLRGEKVVSGQVSSASGSIDYRKQLVEAEAQLLDAFHNWLRSPELHKIRTAIVTASHNAVVTASHRVDVCLRCSPLDLARLPWETWEIGQELGVPRRIRIAREPQNIQDSSTHPIRRQARILAIFGNDNGLNLEKDIKAINSLSTVAKVDLFDCQKYNNPSDLLKEICQKIADPTGWDILFFAGHSNESSLTGGELQVTKNISLFIKDIAPSLQTAKQNGLQFAVFNSCWGLNIAESLIDLGLSQVAIMREPIHDRVAHVFIQQFLTSLTEYKDVHEALLDACECLKQQENKVEFPSAYWVPSLFRHPNADLFRIQPFGLRNKLKRRLPTRGEAIGLAACLLTSLLPPVQDLLLDGRLWVQALNRQLTGDIPAQVESPILLVKVDPLSLKEAEIEKPRPIPQDYLASLLEAATERNASIVGIDYLLDDAEGEPTPEQRIQLKQAIEGAAQDQTQLVFAYSENERSEYTDQGFISEDLIPFDQARHGDINFYPTLLDLPASGTSCGSRKDVCPFAYELARLYTQTHSPQTATPLAQQSSSSFPWRVTFSAAASQPSFLAPENLFGITSFSENFLQAWFHPILDFSLPPDRAYRTISACELLNQCTGEGNTFTDLTDTVVVIAPGEYEEAGIEDSKDNRPPPAALSVWQQNSFTGGEVHAYMLHHLLANDRVYPIPDLWMILLVAIAAKELRLRMPYNRQQKKWALAPGLASLGYGVLCLQIFQIARVVVPIVLPVTMLWLYAYLAQRSGSDGRRVA